MEENTEIMKQYFCYGFSQDETYDDEAIDLVRQR